MIIGLLRRVDWAELAEWAVLLVVLAIAALISYTHLRTVWEHAASPWPALGPLLVDGLFAAAWLRMRRRRREGQEVGALAWGALGLALAATLAGNLASAWVTGHHDPLAYVVAGWPAVAFALVWELVTGHRRGHEHGVVSGDATPDTTPAPTVETVAEEKDPPTEPAGDDRNAAEPVTEAIPAVRIAGPRDELTAKAEKLKVPSTLIKHVVEDLAGGMGRPTLLKKYEPKGLTYHQAKELVTHRNRVAS